MKKKKLLALVLIIVFIISALNITMVNNFQAQAAIPADCPEDMIAYWKFDETVGPPYVDSVGGNNGGCTGICPTMTTTAIVGNAQQFSGGSTSTSRISVDPAAFNWAAADSFSIEFWMKRSAPGWEVVIGRDSAASSSLHWWIGTAMWTGYSGEIVFFLRDNAGGDGGYSGGLYGPVVGDNNWHHIVAVKERAGPQDIIYLYVDGRLEDSQDGLLYTNPFSGPETVDIGWLHNFELPYAGILDEMAIYDRALSWPEIQYHYILGLDGLGYCEPSLYDCDEPVNIMLLGDSITMGNSLESTDPLYYKGYRAPLWYELQDNGYYVDFVGSLEHGQNVVPSYDIDHEGYGGKTASWLNTRLNGPDATILPDNPPDIILYHIGTNDLGGTAIATYAADVDTSLDIIYDFDPTITVILARITLTRDAARNIRTHDYNDLIEDIAHDWADLGYSIIVVDIENALTYPDDLALPDDNLHPNQIGYNKMAGVWFEALQVLLPVCFPPEPPTSCPEGIISHWRLDEGFDSTPAGPPYVDSYDGNDAVPIGTSPTFVPGIVEGGQMFDRSSAIGIDVAGADFNWSAGDSFTIEFWMLKDTDCSSYTVPGNEVIVGRDGHGEASSNVHWWVGVACSGGSGGTAPILFGISDKDGGSDSAWITGSRDVTDGVWHHVVALKDGSQTRLYLDGSLEGSATAAFSSGLDASRNLNLGYMAYSGTPGYYYTGVLDELAIYNRALTLDEIECHYNGGAGRDYCEECPTEPPPPSECPDGMVSYWKLDETSGTVFDDYFDGNDGSGAGHNPTPASGIIGGAQDFDGSTQYITVADDDSLDWGAADSFTVEVWAKFTNIASMNKVMIGRDQESVTHWWLGANTGTGYANWQLASTAVTGTTAINNNVWHHIVGVRDESVNQNRLYVDGALAGQTTVDYTAGFAATTTLGIGYMAYHLSPSYYYDGLLDEIAIYNRALTLDEIQCHYNGGAGRDYCEECIPPEPPTGCPDDMISYWNFDDCVSPYEDYFADNDATCTNCPDCTTGIVGNAVQFNGVNDAVNVIDDGSFDWGVGQSFSIEYWMKSTSDFSGNEVIIGRQGPTHPQPHIWTGGHDDGDQAIFVLFDSSGSNGGNNDWPKSGTDISDGVWHHIVAVKDSTHIRIYVDGEEKQSVPKTYPAGFGSTTDLNIGYLNLGGGYYYEGALDEVALYNRALTLTEIQQHYTNGLAGYGYCEEPEETSTSTATVTESETFTETVTVTQSDTVTESFTNTVTQSSTETVYAAIEMLSGEVHVVVGGTSGVTRGKPAGTVYAAWIDSTAGGALLGMSEAGHFCWDTDTSYIDPATGEPTGVPAGATLVASGGPLVNGPVKYYEANRATEGTPAYYGKVGGLQSFLKSSDDSVLAGLTPSSTHDLFIIEIFTDSQGRNVILIYGLAGRGTLAGALYFADNADYFDGKSGFWIYEWIDSGTVGAEGHPDPPGTDTYTQITSG